MKLLERILPRFVTRSPRLYNLTVLAAGIALFLLTVKLVAAMAVIVTVGAAYWLKGRGWGLDEALMPLMILAPVAAALAYLVLCAVLVIANWHTK